MKKIEFQNKWNFLLIFSLLFKGILCDFKQMKLHGVDIKYEDKCECGGTKATKKIKNGNDAIRGEFPFLIAVVNEGLQSVGCGGTIINNRFVLTAAHCLEIDHDAMKLEVLVNGHDLSGQEFCDMKSNCNKADNKDKRKRIKVKSYIKHENFKETPEGFAYDIGLLELDSDLRLTEDEGATICLPAKGIKTRNGTIVGWASTDEESFSNHVTSRKLKKFQAKITECKKFFEPSFVEKLTQYNFCAKDVKDEDTGNTCMGDSGGPLISKANNFFTQLGVLSFTDSDCSKEMRAGLFTNVHKHLKWILEKTKAGVFCGNPLK